MASQTNLYLPKLFFFFDLQLKFKRIIFRLQLCWSNSYKNNNVSSVNSTPNMSYSSSSSFNSSSINSSLMFDKKAQAFKDFLNTYCIPIF